MKHPFHKYVLLFFIWLLQAYSLNHVYAEGFGYGTLVKTPSGYCPIEQLHVRDEIVCRNKEGYKKSSRIVHIAQEKSAHAIELTFNDQSTLILDLNQKIFLPCLHEWKSIQDIIHHQKWIDLLAIQAIQPLPETALVKLTVSTYHNFYVSTHNINVHNFGIAIPLVFIFGKGGVSFALGESCALLGSWLAGVFLRKLIHSLCERERNAFPPTICTFPQSSPPELFLFAEPKEKKEKKDSQSKEDKETQKEHPNGTYEDAPYHHPNSKKNGKNPPPKDGQKALDNSLEIPGSTGRVAVSDGEIVVLDQTSPGLYHGHIRTWQECTPNMKNALINSGVVKNPKKVPSIGQRKN